MTVLRNVETVTEARRAITEAALLYVALFDQAGVVGYVRIRKGDARALLAGRKGSDVMRGYVSRQHFPGFTRDVFVVLGWQG